MKRLLPLYFFIISSLYGFNYDVKFYMGVGGGIQSETISNEGYDASNAPSYGAIKFGYGDIRAYAVELVLNYIDNKSNIFSPNDQVRYGADVMFLKSFRFTKLLYPYIRAGMGAGEMKVERVLENKAAYSSYNIGLGVFLPLTRHIDLETAYEYRYASYQSIDLIADKLNLTSHINQIYFGINYRF